MLYWTSHRRAYCCQTALRLIVIMKAFRHGGHEGLAPSFHCQLKPQTDTGSQRPLDTALYGVARIGALLFGWSFLLLVFCFKVSEISSAPLKAGTWLVGSMLVAAVYSLPPSLLTRSRDALLLAQVAYAVCFAALCVLGMVIIPHVTSGSLLSGGTVPLGSGKCWAIALFVLMGVGALCGFGALALCGESSCRGTQPTV